MIKINIPLKGGWSILVVCLITFFVGGGGDLAKIAEMKVTVCLFICYKLNSRFVLRLFNICAGLKRIGEFPPMIVLYLRVGADRLFPNSHHCGLAKPAPLSHSK